MTDYSRNHRRLLLGLMVEVTLILMKASVAAAEDVPRLPRVRSHSSTIAEAVAEATRRSVTFRRLIETVDGTDGLVYVDDGKCGRSVRSCLVSSVKIAGPYRVLRILVDLRKAAGAELMASIAHELQHAIEVLSDPKVTSSRAIYLLYHREAPSGSDRFETKAALQAGQDVLNEVLAAAPR